MEHISKTLEAAQSGSATNSTESQERTSRKTDLPNSWTSALFKKLQARYGAKWSANIEGIEKVAVDEWSHVLAGLKGSDIARGLACWNDPWPPSAHEFKRACKQYATAAHKPFDKSKALEKLADPEKAKEAMSEIKAMLNL